MYHQTVECFIGELPQGTVSYISEGLYGRNSDNFLTEKCGVLESLLPADVVEKISHV